jgi:hypothetical protein
VKMQQRAARSSSDLRQHPEQLAPERGCSGR